MNDADTLLHLLSELGTLAPPRLKKTCAAIVEDGKSRQFRMVLPQRLCRSGHAERRPDGGISVVSPIILLTAAGRQILCGARDHQMLRDAEQSGVTLEQTAQVYEPEIWGCAGSDQQVEAFAQHCHIVMANLEPLALLQSLPPIRHVLLTGQEVDAPASTLEFCRWEPPARHKWQTVTEFQKEGFYRTVELSRRDYYYWDGRSALRKLIMADQRDAARWLTGKRSSRLLYDSRLTRLGISYTAPLPVILERCLRCGAGSEPTYESSDSKAATRWYAEVPRRWAAEVARVLECKLQE